MRILLIGVYPYLHSQSMDRFAAILEAELMEASHEVRLLKPPPRIGRIRPSATGVGKWLGYLDRFVLFRPQLSRVAAWADVVHICDHANAVYVPWLRGKPHLVTCHDMLAIRSALGEIPEHNTSPTGRIYQRWILSGLKRAHHVACVSRATREDVLRLTELDDQHVSVVRNGLNYPYRHMSQGEYLKHLDRMGLGNIRPFFFHVGNNNWYKNKEGLLRIFAHIARTDAGRRWSLVLAGARLPGKLRILTAALGIQDRIRETGIVDSEQLRALYSAAEGLIFPSLAEGFGWPVIEAQACGCPVFASNRRPITDIGGDGAVYFDPKDECGAAKAILSGMQGKEHLKELGYRSAIRYSTKAMISGYSRTYRLVMR
jgi:glycosyltransferase involved in cell wall biosynthesis